MKDFDLSKAQVTELRAAHRSCRDKRAAYRLNALILLGQGWRISEVAEALLLDAGTLRSYVTRYQEGGLEALLRDQYTGGLSYLNASQKDELERHLSSHTYLNTNQIIDHVAKAYGVRYSVSGMTDILHSLGFSYKKAKVVPGKTDPEAQERFVEEYKKIKESKEETDPIYFMDGVHPQHNTQPSYGWIKCGEEKQIKSNTGRKRLNINGAIDVQTMRCSVVIADAVNADSTIALFKKLERRHTDSSHIYIICDNAKYYRSRKVKEYLENSRIALKFLPPYSPNLNLIERYWKYFKKIVLYNQYYECFDTFKSACEQFFRNIKRHKKALQTLLTENF